MYSQLFIRLEKTFSEKVEKEETWHFWKKSIHCTKIRKSGNRLKIRSFPDKGGDMVTLVLSTTLTWIIFLF